jgi:translation elongation factor P/translation initiation factor 5A
MRAVKIWSVLVSVLVVVPILVTSSPANATSPSAGWAVASNGQSVVSIAPGGRLQVASAGNPATLSDVPSLSSQNVSSVVWDGKYFVATGFFSIFFSADGTNWTRMSMPTGTYFNPGNIISDREFFDSKSMSRSDISKFLKSKVSSCRSGFVCLKDYSEETWDRPATPLCRKYSSSGVESAARIIYKVARACGISPQVLLVLLQKEQGLVTHTAPDARRYQVATGYACPDTAPCNSEYFGFYNQVYNAAKQFKRYANPPGTTRFFTWYPVGATSQILNHPNAACGRQPVRIENQATANLYYYTPYAPNPAALSAYNGPGDSCSAYGNRNFWRIYNVWFSNGGDYRNWALTTNGVGMVVDQDGTSIRVDLDNRRWSFSRNVPKGRTAQVVSVGLGNSGQFVAQRGDGKQYQLTSKGRWKAQTSESLTQPGLERFSSVGKVSVSGSAVAGRTLTAKVSGWKPRVDTVEYQWLRDGSPIPKATKKKYKLKSADAGKRISVRITGSKAGFESVMTASKNTKKVVRALDSTPAPKLSGSAAAGKTLTARPGKWDSGVSLSYRWLRDGEVIEGATKSTYKVKSSDAGKRISVRVTGKKSGFKSVSKNSSQTRPVTVLTMTNQPTPTVSGKARNGQTLTARPGKWDSGVSLRYRWLRDGKTIKGAKSATYTLTSADVGKKISVRVTGKKSGYASVATTSAETGSVKALKMTRQPTPKISGTATEGQTLTARPGKWDSGVSLGYRWLRDGKTIKGAKSATYTLSSADVGKKISVRIKGKKAGYRSLTRVSAETVPIAPVIE